MIPWIPLLTAGATLLGSLFGNQNNQSQTTAQTTVQNENSNTTGTTTTGGSTSMNSATNQTSTQNQQSHQASDQDTNQVQTGSVKRLDDTTLAALTQAVQSAIGGGTGAASTKARLDQVTLAPDNFDVDQYVAGIMTGAKSRMSSDLESGGNQIASKAGASTRTNSAAALLRGKLNQQGNAELAATEADARAKGTQLKQGLEESKTGQITNLAAATDSSINGILGALLQSNETQKADTVGNTSGTTDGTTSTTGTVKENQAQTQIEAQQQQILQQVLTGTSATTNQTTNKNDSSLNWGDFLTKIGSIFSTTFENPAT